MHIAYMYIHVQYNKTIHRAYAAQPRQIKRKYKYLLRRERKIETTLCTREKVIKLLGDTIRR